MSVEMEFAPVDPTSRTWFENLVSRSREINELISKRGKSWWRVLTNDGKEFRATLFLAEAPYLFLGVGTVSDKIGLRKLKALVKDEAAEKGWNSCEGTAGRDQYWLSWAKGGDRWEPSWL